MDSDCKRSVLVLLSSLVILVLAIGCGGSGGNPLSPENLPQARDKAEASLAFRIEFPPGWSSVRANIIPDGPATPTVTFRVILFDIASATTRTLTKTSPVEDGKAGATFAGLPAFPAVGKVGIDGGKYNNASAFSGSIDLKGGENTMVLYPEDVNATTTVAAHVMVELANNHPAKFAAAPKNLTEEVNKTIAGMDLGSPTIRSDALAAFLDTIAVQETLTLGRGNLCCTLIMHGFDPGTSGEPAWMEAMQDAILARSGGSGKKARMVVSGTKGNLNVSCNPWDLAAESSSSGEVVVRLDWTSVANYLLTGVSAQEVAAAVAPRIFEGQNGQRPLAEIPLHLIGHSRGGGMVYELARLLGEKGLDVDHVTSLDPHPLTTDDTQPLFGAPVVDTPVRIYENILFADSFWQGIAYPKGEYVPGAFNRLWTNLPGGYHQAADTKLQSFADHLNIILMYHATANLVSPVSNVEAQLTAENRSIWFNDAETLGEREGFFLTRNIDALNRKSDDCPVQGADKIRAGYHNDPNLGGDGARQPLAWTEAIWPNALAMDLVRGGTILGRGSHVVNSGEKLEIRLVYRDYDSISTVTFLLDSDRNPYNDNFLKTVGSKTLGSTGKTLSLSSTEWDTKGVSSSGTVYFCARISDGTRKRFLYW